MNENGNNTLQRTGSNVAHRIRLNPFLCLPGRLKSPSTPLLSLIMGLFTIIFHDPLCDPESKQKLDKDFLSDPAEENLQERALKN